MTGFVVLLVAVGLALGFGAWRRLSDGRFRATSAAEAGRPGAVPDPMPDSVPDAGAETVGSVLDGTPWADGLGERATLLQFSSAFCAPCRATRRVLSEVADDVEGVVHVEVDAEQHLEIVRRLGILRTPTTLVLDARGAEVGRASGAARKDQVLAALGAVR